MTMQHVSVRRIVCLAVMAAAVGAAQPAVAQKPKIPATIAEPGKASGELTVNSQTAKLVYASAVAEPDSFEKGKTQYRVTLSDQPIGKYVDLSKVEAGTLHYMELSIGSTKEVYGTMLHHKAFSRGVMSSSGSGHKFEVEQLGPDVVAGRAYLESPKKLDQDTFTYAVTFRAPVEPAK